MKANALRIGILQAVATLSVVALILSAAPRAGADDHVDAKRLVREAIEADMHGQREQRDSVLSQALRIAPDYALARWHSGQTQVGGKWMDLNDAQLQAVSRGRIAQYRQLRDIHATSLQGHRLLARYCRKHALKDRERLHWYAILQAQPGNIEAIRCLGLLPHRGALLTQEQIDQLEAEEKQWGKARSKWRPILTELKTAIGKGSIEERKAALEQLRAIDDPQAVFFAQQILSSESDELTLELIALFGRIESPLTTNLLVNHTVLHESAAVRDAATACLKERSWFTFVPTLMGSLATPIEMSFSATPMADGMYSCISLYREGPLAEYSQRDGFRGQGRGARGRAASSMIAWGAATMAANRTQRQVAMANAQVESRNERIDEVLREITEHETDGRPQSWWQWWQEYNDVYVPEEKPLVETENESVFSVAVNTCECFLPGTPVWTETGPEPIERVQVGDRVLAQDPTTGELAYKLVLQTTLRPIGETVRVGVDGEDIYATNGHPFWVVGKGWRMARKLQPGWRVHTPNGSRVISHVEEGPESRAHNMMVEDFRCFFVGNDGILVHDNTVRRPTAALVPGVGRQ